MPESSRGSSRETLARVFRPASLQGVGFGFGLGCGVTVLGCPVAGGTEYCKAHGGGRRCTHDGCSKASAAGGTEHCIAHGGGRRCQHENCSTAAQGGTPLCIAHGGGRRCQMEGCAKSAQGGTQISGTVRPQVLSPPHPTTAH